MKKNAQAIAVARRDAQLQQNQIKHMLYASVALLAAACVYWAGL